ncbi:MAG: DUF2806 domain-containing protein [Patescibacteria group bacterium]
MSEGNSLINLGDLSKPANTLIEKISEAIGGIFKPWQTRRVAKADADAEQIKAISKIEMTELEQRALQRFMYEEEKKQSNIESITCQSLPQLNEGAKPEKIEDDWITNFFDKCRLVSDEEMQGIWARILASEANTPGRFSKRTVNFMESLGKHDAQLFTKLCAFNWILGEIQPLIYDLNADIYIKNGINFSILKHLDAIGLISFESLAGYKRHGFAQKTVAVYKNAPFVLKFPKESDNEINIGKVLLTSIGKELASICAPETIAGFDQYVIEEWKKKGIDVNNITSPAKPSPNDE